MKKSDFKSISWSKLFLELLVVFLGVSAGFLLQNSKEDSSNNEQEQKYIQSFLSDIDVNINNLKESIEDDSLWLKKTEYAIYLIVKDSLSIDSANTLIILMSNFTEFSGQVNTYTNITNSGNLNLITDYGLKQTIVEYHKSLEELDILNSVFSDFRSENFMPFIIGNYDMFMQQFVNPEMAKSTDFTNIFGIQFSLTQQRLEAYKLLLKESEDYRDLLER